MLYSSFITILEEDHNCQCTQVGVNTAGDFCWLIENCSNGLETHIAGNPNWDMNPKVMQRIIDNLHLPPGYFT